MRKKSGKGKKNPISLTVNLLMEANKLTEAELARRSKIPQTSINRLLLGLTENPRVQTLIPLAKFFNVSYGQLIGFEPLNAEPSVEVERHGSHAKLVPLIPWESIRLFRKEKYVALEKLAPEVWLPVSKDCSDETYALKSKPFLTPQFHEQSILIIDPIRTPRDGNWVIISFKETAATIRQLMIDGATTYLKPVGLEQSIAVMTSESQLLGVVVESRRSRI